MILMNFKKGLSSVEAGNHSLVLHECHHNCRLDYKNLMQRTFSDDALAHSFVVIVILAVVFKQYLLSHPNCIEKFLSVTYFKTWV